MAEDTEVLTENTNHINEAVEETAYIGEEKNEKIQNAESSMLEDETMPTYLSLPSITISSKPDESKTQLENSSPQSVTQDDKSVYDISSGDESNQQAYEHEHDGGYGDSDETEHDDDSEDEDEDEDDGEESEIEEENDDDIEPEQFERSSDDYVLKSSSYSDLNKYCKERSKSFEDLSTKKKSKKMNCKKLMILTPHGYEPVVMKENPMYNSLCSSKKNSLPSMKHNNIPTKVKRFIHDLIELNKKSGQQKIDEELNPIDPLGNCTIKDGSEGENESTINLESQCLADYTENKTHTRTLRESPNFIEVNINNHIIENGVGIEVVNVKNNCNKSEEMDMDVESDDEQIKDVNRTKQPEKLNGKIDYAKENLRTPINYNKTEKDDPEDLTNKEEPKLTVLNLQKFNKNSKTDNFQEAHSIEEVKMDDHVDYIDENNEVMIKPINTTPMIDVHNAQKIMINEALMEELKKREIEIEEKNSQILSLQLQLNQKEEERKKIEKDYREVLDTVSELKKEGEDLKKTLKTFADEKKSKKSQDIAVQTEDQPKKMGHTSTKTQLQPTSNKISVSSIGSTLSSIEQWTASDYSPAVSMNPPTIGNLINSDASTTVNTPRNKAPINSPRTILTATRIIQALASMTPGKADGNVGGQIPDIQGQLEETTSPLIQKEFNSRKRKASETFGSSVSGSKPFKIPNININDHRKFNSNSDTDAAGESFGVSPRGLTENDDISGNHDKKQKNIEKSDEDDVKCIVWHENGQTKQRSCLIQASVADDSPKTKGQVRHCGPYLLGNVEVRISEANGTLNVWGKELNGVEDKSDNLDEYSSDKINNTGSQWIKTPQEKSDDFQCSKNKRSKTASSVKASICRHLKSIINRTPSPVNHAAEEEIDSLNHHDCGNATCGFKEINKTKNSSNPFPTTCYSHFNKLNSPDKQFCCLHKGEESLGECGFKKDEEVTDNIHYLYDMTRTIIGQDSRPTIHQINNQTYDCCKNQIPREDRTKNHSRRSSLLHQCSFNNETENPYVHSYKRPCYHSSKMTNQSRETSNDGNNLHNYDTGCPDEDDFIPSRFPEVAEDKKNRYRGKRVRGLMDFLKGCGDCKNPHTTSFDSSHIPETISTNTRSIPSIRVDSAPPTLSCPKKSLKNNYNKRCCNCKKQIGLTTKIEAELEEFRVAITNLNLKSDALREMLSRVLNTD